jgi:hypothetical protein
LVGGGFTGQALIGWRRIDRSDFEWREEDSQVRL